MKIDDVMDEIKLALDVIPDLNVHAHPVDTLTPPAAEVLYPSVTYDQAFQRGLDFMEGGIIVSVGSVFDRAARDNLARYAGGADSPHSIHAAIHARTLAKAWTSCDVVQVRVGFGVDHVVNEVAYVAYRFNLDIHGAGN